MSRTFTQYLLDLNCDDPRHAYAHVLSSVGIALKRMSATISRGCLNLRQAGDGPCRDGDETNRAISAASIAMILEEAGSCSQLAGVSFSGDPEIHQISNGPEARCLLAMDVLHRPTTLTENQPIGVTFSVLARSSSQGPVAPEEFLQPASDLLCAGLALFGSSTVLILTAGDGVDGFTLDRDVGNFVLTHPNMMLPGSSDVLAIDLSHASTWSTAIRRYVDERIRDSAESGGRDCIMRWNNSAVLGAYRVLLNGGLFMLPRAADAARCGGVPLVHSAAPLTMLVEHAGGSATDGTTRLATITPALLDEHSPLILGAAGDIRRIEQYAEEPDDGSDAYYPLFHSRTLFVQDL